MLFYRSPQLNWNHTQMQHLVWLLIHGLWCMQILFMIFSGTDEAEDTRSLSQDYDHEEQSGPRHVGRG